MPLSKSAKGPSPNIQIEERRLIEAAQSDRARFVDVYERYFGVVYAFVAHRMDRAVAEDVTSEVFRRAFAHLPRFKWTGAPFGAWLLRIAANLIADNAKRKAREGDLSVDDPATNVSPSVKPSLQRDLEEAERRAHLFKLVEGLAEDQRLVVMMRFAEEKSISEIAEQLGKSEGAVKQLQFRALQTLRARVTGNE